MEFLCVSPRAGIAVTKKKHKPFGRKGRACRGAWLRPARFSVVYYILRPANPFNYGSGLFACKIMKGRWGDKWLQSFKVAVFNQLAHGGSADRLVPGFLPGDYNTVNACRREFGGHDLVVNAGNLAGGFFPYIPAGHRQSLCNFGKDDQVQFGMAFDYGFLIF